MHAHIDELLALRGSALDGPNLPDHVRQCALCSARLRELTSVREGLRRLPLFEAPEGAWDAISSRLASAPSAGSYGAGSKPNIQVRRIVAFAAAAGIGALAVTAILRPSDEAMDGPAFVADAEQPETPSFTHLIQQSRELESMLQTLPLRPSVEPVSTAATLDTIEARIQWLDVRLSDPGGGALSETQARRLWRERVELMDSLVTVRYAHSSHVEF